ncbi:4-hydroxy-tetrahydrodipicolinate reductase [Sphingomonas morindae]|uniref:4-hydroxy-tetrahydrodipicolinate reductase n=1 Tax=Sphingomonas morindae TaxID=1541170 RepID=A0ABY4XAX7_9SPHN|nr:4-hydroxy-tetrahydrodipicolinate reductase [Sphingomonas morindae]USI74040.1 4-hydroxy-tetrahydrodipicolinate reductase [Sphingomonas morindae]
MTQGFGLFGAGGRMGLAIAAAAREAGQPLAGGLGRTGAVFGPFEDAAALAGAAAALIDFSTPEALEGHLDAAIAAGTPMLIGTTGLGAAHQRLIDRAAERIALLPAANTALGVTVLAALVEQAARLLGPEWDCEILDMHHRHKRDAPSGTALLLGAAVHRGRGAGEAAGRDRLDRMAGGPREAGDIYYAALRGGSVAGDHLLVFAGEGERIELGHRAESRAIFARGALRAARWLAEGRAPGRYTMNHVLGLA